MEENGEEEKGDGEDREAEREEDNKITINVEFYTL